MSQPGQLIQLGCVGLNKIQWKKYVRLGFNCQFRLFFSWGLLVETKFSRTNMLGQVLIVDLDDFICGLLVETKFISTNMLV